MKRLNHSYPNAYPIDVKSKKADAEVTRSALGLPYTVDRPTDDTVVAS